MVNKLFALMSIMTIIGITISMEEAVMIKFLKGATRLGHPNITDYYFSCNIRGLFLQWRYNGRSLTGFNRDEVGHSKVLRISNFTYSTSLISSEIIGRNKRAMHSIIVVSFYNLIPSSFSLTCSQGRIRRTETSKALSMVENSAVAPDNNNSDDIVILDYITISNIVNATSHIHILMCGTEHSQIFKVNNNSPIVFLSSDMVGHNISTLEKDANTVSTLGTFITQDPFLTSLYFVSNDFGVNVSCCHGNNCANLQLNPSFPTTGNTSTVTNLPITYATMAASGETVAVENVTMSTIPTYSAQTGTNESTAANNEHDNMTAVWVGVVFVIALVIGVVASAITVLLIKYNNRLKCRNPKTSTKLCNTENGELSQDVREQRHYPMKNIENGPPLNIDRKTDTCSEGSEKKAHFRGCCSPKRKSNKKESRAKSSSRRDVRLSEDPTDSMNSLPVQEEGYSALLSSNPFYLLSPTAASETANSKLRQFSEWNLTVSSCGSTTIYKEEFGVVSTFVPGHAPNLRRRY